MMDFDLFKDNVERWSMQKGIYKQSTAKKQAAKAMEEIGEYMSANTDYEKMDAIGDIAVCLVNACYFAGTLYRDFKLIVTEAVGIEQVAYYTAIGSYRYALRHIYSVCLMDGFKIEDCFQLAWDSIKDRKGKMVGGIFVKDE
jgi:hypothetical protein